MALVLVDTLITLLAAPPALLLVQGGGIFIGESPTSLDTLPADLTRILNKPEPTGPRWRHWSQVPSAEASSAMLTRYAVSAAENLSVPARISGGVMVPMNPLLKPEQVLYIARDCNVQVLVTSPDRLALLVPLLGLLFQKEPQDSLPSYCSTK